MNPPSCKPVSKFMQSIDLVRRYMETFKYCIHDGSVFKKVRESKFTYVYFSPVKQFLMRTLGNPEIADQIHAYIPSMTQYLSEKSCRLIQPITIDFNFIECLPAGYCFNITEKKFEKDPDTLEGSPRAFVKYHYTGVVPNPHPFTEGKLDFVYKLSN